MPLHDTSYQHWEGTHLGLWHRRRVIAVNGLRSCLQNKLLRALVLSCWGAGLVMTALLFAVGQLLVADSIVVQWVATFNPDLQVFARLLMTWLEQHPEVSVRTTQDVLFFFFSLGAMPLSIFAVGIAIPVLITRDLASNAIIIYSSKAVSRWDYLLGKFATAFGLMCLTWLGPMTAAWIFGNLLAPDWRFFWHARTPLAHALLFALCSMSILSLLALGVSATASKEKATAALWFMWWILGGVVEPIAAHTKPWLRHLNFSFDLRQLALAIFKLSEDVKIAQEKIPVLGGMLKLRPETRHTIESPAVWGSVIALVLMGALAVIIIRRRVKPE